MSKPSFYNAVPVLGIEYMELGKVAYEAHVAFWKDLSPKTPPTWDELVEIDICYWCTIAGCVRDFTVQKVATNGN